jgi:hypothetical protein
MRVFAYLIIVLALLTGCNNAKVKKTGNLPGSPTQATSAASQHQVVAKDILQTSGYTYLLLNEDGKEYWAAVSRFEAEKGKTYYFKNGMEMTNFKSKELNRTFDTIQFIEDLSDQPIPEKKAVKLTTKGRQSMAKVEGIKVEPVSGGVKISEIFSNMANYAGKKVKVRGQVIKFSPQIMNKNWVHLQDGTEANGSYDLTLTTMDAVEVGKVVTFEGVIATDKDFGYGYKYNVLLEDAKVIQ